MVSISNKIKNIAVSLVCAMAVLSSCNKELEQFAEAPVPVFFPSRHWAIHSVPVQMPMTVYITGLL